MPSIDDSGRALDCHFLIVRSAGYRCLALESFYNAADPTDLCFGCPFFKTDEQFYDSREKAAARNKKDVTTQKLRIVV